MSKYATQVEFRNVPLSIFLSPYFLLVPPRCFRALEGDIGSDFIPSTAFVVQWKEGEIVPSKILLWWNAFFTCGEADRSSRAELCSFF